MVALEITDDTLDLEVEGLDKLWALKSRFRIPLRNVRGAHHDPARVVVIELDDPRYDELIVEVADAADAVRRIREARQRVETMP